MRETVARSTAPENGPARDVSWRVGSPRRTLARASAATPRRRGRGRAVLRLHDAGVTSRAASVRGSGAEVRSRGAQARPDRVRVLSAGPPRRRPGSAVPSRRERARWAALAVTSTSPMTAMVAVVGAPRRVATGSGRPRVVVARSAKAGARARGDARRSRGDTVARAVPVAARASDTGAGEAASSRPGHDRLALHVTPRGDKVNTQAL
jgi:hypothetical protein